MPSDPFDLWRWYHELGVLGIGIHHRLGLLCVGILWWLRWRIVGTWGRRLFMTQTTAAWWQLVRILPFNRGNVRFHRSCNKRSRKYSTARTLRNNRYHGLVTSYPSQDVPFLDVPFLYIPHRYVTLHTEYDASSSQFIIGCTRGLCGCRNRRGSVRKV